MRTYLWEHILYCWWWSWLMMRTDSWRCWGSKFVRRGGRGRGALSRRMLRRPWLWWSWWWWWWGFWSDGVMSRIDSLRKMRTKTKTLFLSTCDLFIFEVKEKRFLTKWKSPKNSGCHVAEKGSEYWYFSLQNIKISLNQSLKTSFVVTNVKGWQILMTCTSGFCQCYVFSNRMSLIYEWQVSGEWGCWSTETIHQKETNSHKNFL